jgi:hypothetical protein
VLAANAVQMPIVLAEKWITDHPAFDRMVYTNDRYMLRAARHFHLTGVDVLSDNG